ncbi:hypothetical protein [Streptomyces fulvoviolaceus]|uniref:hypothetical protein n=1 Tax=Streptomyces fulvoviolaceus TaxID=285535 RepID=UPI0021C14E93|nr:hypothetical protein [Streptomyces fulvoviolaceus]MCT9075135.1 hypothetical protein [Streptomyces fulvoviolaceus]
MVDMLLVMVALIGGLVGGGAMFALVRRDVGTRRAALVAAVTFAAVGIGWLLALYGVVLGLGAAIVAYAVTRSRIGADKALLAAGGSYFAVVSGFAVLLYTSLETM